MKDFGLDGGLQSWSSGNRCLFMRESKRPNSMHTSIPHRLHLYVFTAYSFLLHPGTGHFFWFFFGS